MNKKTIILIIALLAMIPLASFYSQTQSDRRPQNAPVTVNEQASFEVAFSPNQGADELILRLINGSASSIRLASYSFTSPEIVTALIDAKTRGVDVAVIVDHKQNIESSQDTAKHALQLLVNNQIPVATVNTFNAFHDKFIVVDGLHVQTGSYNYTRAAANQNSENVLVIWNSPTLAVEYLNHWQNSWNTGNSFIPIND